MREWLTVRVELVSGGGIDFVPAGRVLLVGPDHTFGDLGDAINLHFARWDLSHLHQFELADGRTIGFPDLDSPETLDQETILVGSALDKGDEFEFVFDFGDWWTHKCRVEDAGAGPKDLESRPPRLPVPIWGWGTIPDQYGRESE